MTTKPINPTDTTQPATPCAPLKASSPPGPAFEMRFTSTPRGARLARRLAAIRLDAWGIPYGTDPHDAIVLIVAELTANAVSHGHVPGRDFHFRLRTTPDGRTVRVEVTDTRTERHPRRPALPENAAGVEETGRGLLLVSQLATPLGLAPVSGRSGQDRLGGVRARTRRSTGGELPRPRLRCA